MSDARPALGPTFDPHPVIWTSEKIGLVWSFNTRDDDPRRYFSAHSGARIVRYVARRIRLEAQRVLDFGCGPGYLMRHFLDLGITCAGVEFAEESVKAATDALADHPGFRGVTHATTVPTPLAAGSHDVIFLVEVIEHLLDDQVAPTLDELERVLAPGGHLVVTTPNAEDLSANVVRCPDCGAVFHRWQHVRSFTPSALRELLTDRGFDVLSAEGTYFGPLNAWQHAKRSLRSLIGRAYSPHLIAIARKRL